MKKKKIRNELVALTKKLISFKTTENNPAELKRCTDFVIKYLHSPRILINKYVHNNKPSIVALFSNKQPDIFLVAHADVVPAEDELFKAKIAGNRLYGRGSCDNKGPAAALMILIKELAKQKQKPSVGLMITFDEEIGGENGVGFLLKEKNYKCKLAIIPDGGGDSSLVTKEKGYLRIKLSAKGRASHSSRPWKGENAIEKLIEAYSEIRKEIPHVKKESWQTTMNLSRLHGGEAMNIVPDYAELWLDIRHTEKTNKQELIRKLKKAIARFKGVNLSTLSYGNMFFTKKTKEILALKKAAEKTLGKKIKFSAEHGASDARFFSEKGIPAILFMPICENAHAKDEYIEMGSLEKFYNVLKEFLSKN